MSLVRGLGGPLPESVATGVRLKLRSAPRAARRAIECARRKAKRVAPRSRHLKRLETWYRGHAGKAAAVAEHKRPRLARWRKWWKRHRSGPPCPMAPSPNSSPARSPRAEHRMQADTVVRWHRPGRTDAILEVYARWAPNEDIARERTTGPTPEATGRFGEARTEMETPSSLGDSCACATVSVPSPTFSKASDVPTFTRTPALGLSEQFPIPRALSHNNLATTSNTAALPSRSAPVTSLPPDLPLVARLGQDSQSRCATSH